MDNDTFRKHGHALVDWIADYYERIEELPVLSRAAPGEIAAGLPRSAPTSGEEMEKIVDDFEARILPGITHWQHPSWFAYFPANASPPSILAELLTAGLGAQCMSWHTSPAATELEEVTMGWLARMIGLPDTFTGVIQDTASTATLTAVICARERALEAPRENPVRLEDLVVYASGEAHSSVEKAVRIAGLSPGALRSVPTDDEFAMLPDALEEMIEADLVGGSFPACVVATVGTTSSTAVDPVPQIAQICERRGAWLHVDAAYAGTAAVLPEMRWILEGVERADSFVFNPHKWMLTNFDLSAYFVRDPDHLVRTFSMEPEYLKTKTGGPVRNLRDWGIPLGRRFRALKLWFVLRSYGVDGIRSMVSRHLELAAGFARRVEEDPRFELMAPVRFGLVCFRIGGGMDEELLEELNGRLLDAMNANGRLYLSHTRLDGKLTLRLAIGSRLTEERHVDGAWKLASAAADALLEVKP